MPDNLCLITLGSVTMHIKFTSFLKLIVNSCIAELDLFKLICTTLIFLLFSIDSAIDGWMPAPCLITLSVQRDRIALLLDLAGYFL